MKMFQNKIEHVWPLIVSYTFLLSVWLIIRQGLPIFIFIFSIFIFIYHLGLYHVTEGLISSVQNMKHTCLGTKLTFSKSIPVCILALVSIYYYLPTRLLSPLIHENAKSNLFFSSLSLQGPYIKVTASYFQEWTNNPWVGK